MLQKNNEIILFLLVTICSNVIKCNENDSSDVDSVVPNSDTSNDDLRRMGDEEDEGLAIEVPFRRSMDNKLNSDDSLVNDSPPIKKGTRRIYNPDETTSTSDHPYMAAILANNELWCGGVIIDKDKVLTAAHCLQLQYNNRFFREYMRMFTVRVGSDNATHGGQIMKVSEIFFHPNYVPQSLQFNLAVLKLHKNLTFFDSRTNSVYYSNKKILPPDRNITFLGWGSVEKSGENAGDVLLQKISLPIYNIRDCQDIYGRDLVTENNFCAGYISIAKNVCNHDAGGPAILDNVVVGILSFSYTRCDVPDKPAVFTLIGDSAKWLDNLEVTGKVGYRVMG